MIQRKWNRQKLKNQILMIQSIVIAIIIAILISLSFYLVNRFSIFIQEEFFQTLILKSMVATLQNTNNRVNQIQWVQQLQQYIDMRSKENLYYFQASNNIYMSTQVGDCLQSEHSQQFYSYQFCYGIYGQLTNSTDLNQIKDYIALQNTLIPLFSNNQIKTDYVIYLDQSLFLSQYYGEYLTSLDSDLVDVFHQMDTNQYPVYYMEGKRNNTLIQLIFNNIRGTKIATGTIKKITDDELNKISQQDIFFRSIYFFVQENGDVFYDSRNIESYGYKFYNTSMTGFDEKQFQKIKDFYLNNLSIINECQFHIKNEFICLVDIIGQPKIIQSVMTVVDDLIFFYIIVIDAKSSIQTIEEFERTLQNSLYELIKNFFILLLVTLVLCFILQMMFIEKLNKPLNDLQDIAKYHINNQQYNILTGIKVIKQQNQIQKLADAFFNLINLNQKSKNKGIIQGIEFKKQKKQILGTIQRRHLLRLLNQIRRHFKFRTGNHSD